jgi:hypothetical protein
MSIKASLKTLEGTKWVLCPLSGLLGQSILSFMVTTDKECIAALLEDERPILFISNREENVKKYKEKGLSLSATDLLYLVGSEMILPQVINIFPDATFVSRESDAPADSKKWW